MKDIKVSDYLALIHAGYTKEEIDSLTTETNVDEVSSETNVDEVSSETNVESVEQKPLVNTSSKSDELLSTLIDEVKALKKQMQKSAIANDVIGSNSDTAQDILASIINPKIENK